MNEGFQNFFIIGHYKIEMIINHLKKFNSQINIEFIKEKTIRNGWRIIFSKK